MCLHQDGVGEQTSEHSDQQDKVGNQHGNDRLVIGPNVR